MENVPSRVKALRESARPALTVRKIAALMGMPTSSYAFYEDQKKFKKAFLPVEFARALADILAAHGVDYREVMALAGYENPSDPGAQPLVAPQPPVQYVQLNVALPSEAVLRRMFEGLLEPLERDISWDELARTLAEQLPIALAAVRDLVPPPFPSGTLDVDVAAPASATDHRGSQRSPRT